MAAGAQSGGWNGPSRRRVPRFDMQTPVDVTVLRGGVSDTLPGRSMNVGERGIAAVLAGELAPGEMVTLDVSLTPDSEPVRTTAAVRYHDKLRCGFEFISLSPDQRSAIRDWTRSVNPDAIVTTTVAPIDTPAFSELLMRDAFNVSDQPTTPRRARIPKFVWMIVLLVVVVAGAIVWWRWNQGWKELESGLHRSGETMEKPVQVSTEEMQKLLVHRVDPVYPDEARQQNLQGIVALDIVVSRDGNVVSMRPLNGPDVLANAAMDALRWWKFSPYRVNGQPVAAETTMAVEFRRQ